jgi:hypothetical protein
LAATLPKKCCEKVSVEENAANKDFDTVRKYAESNSEKPVRVLMRDMVEELGRFTFQRYRADCSS